MIASLVVAVLLTGVCSNNNASPTGSTRMTVSKMRMADLESSASGYAYNQQGALPATYVLYTNHGSGRYYHAPAPVHYVVGSPAPVAHAVSETASPHEPVLLAYATAKHEIVPYAAGQPYPRDGFINYDADQLAKYAQPLKPPKLQAARAPYYPANASAVNEMHANIDKRSDDEEAGNDNESDDDDNDDNDGDDDEEDTDGEDEKDEDHVTEDYEKAIDFTSTRPIDILNNLRPNIDVSFEHGDGVKYSAAQNSAHGENGDKGYYKRKEFDVGERGRHDKSRQQGHYDTKIENKKLYSDTAGNYGRHDESKRDEKNSSYGQTSYHKKGQKTRGFHKVYHKDEYKKDTDFYDESHKKGYFDDHAVADEHYNTAEGDFKKGGRSESAFNYEDRGKKNYYDKGLIENHDRGYNKKKGENSFHNNYEKHDSDEDTHLTKKHGYEKSNHHQ